MVKNLGLEAKGRRVVSGIGVTTHLGVSPIGKVILGVTGQMNVWLCFPVGRGILIMIFTLSNMVFCAKEKA